MTRAIIADASRVSGAEFLKALTGDPNDISSCPQASGYYLRDGAWMKIREHHVGVKDAEQLTECVSDPLLNRRVG